MKTQIQTRIGLAVGLALALIGGLAPRAEAAGYQMPITFGGYTNRSEALTNFPVLVTLARDIGGSGFTFDNFATTNGYDLRFYTNASDTGSGLDYEIEAWNTNSIAAATNIAGCVLWLKADAGTLTNGSGAVTNWLDQSGNGNNALNTATPPTLTNGVVNGRPAIRFNGSTTYLDTTFTACTGAHTVIFVAVRRGNSGGDDYGPEVSYHAGGTVDRGAPHYVKNSNLTGASYPCYNNGNYDGLGAYANDTPYMIVLPFQQGAWSVYKNGSVEGSGTASGGYKSDITGLRLGGQAKEARQWNGDVAEVIVYSRVLSATELAQVNDYLSRKYGIAVPASQASYVWVRVPSIPGDGSGRIYAKWGDASSQLPCTTNGAVWADHLGAWHMSGNALDSTPSTNHGTIYNSPTTVGGQIGTALDLAGSAYVLTRTVSLTNKFTVSAWVKRAANQFGWITVVANEYSTGSDDTFYFGFNENNYRFYTYTTSGAGKILTGSAAPNGVWLHIAATYDGANMIYYVNGVQNAILAQTGNFNVAGSRPVGIGADSNDGGSSWAEKFNGVVDQVELTTSVRSSNWVWAAYANQASNTTFATYGITELADMSSPRIQNRAPSGVTTNGAAFNGYLATNGTSTATVYVAWGQTNGSVSGSWATTNWWNPGDWTNGSYPSTNMTLAANANYYYTFGATNSATNVVASGYQYLITGEVTVQATDPTGRVTLADTAAFTVYRPASCTNDDLIVNYSLGGTATNGTHYTTSPATTVTNGTVTILAGQTNAVITVQPLNATAPEQTVVLTLETGGYAIGPANAATCTLVAATAWPVGSDRYWVAAAPGNWNNTANWSFAPFGPGGWSVPASTNVAIFDGGGAGNCAIDATVNVVGLKLNNGYAGIVTQGLGYAVTVGATGYVQNAGTFVGGNADITCTYFTLAGGTFTASSGTNTIAGPNIGNGTIFTYSGGTFNHNGGTLRFRGTTTSAGGGQYYTLSLVNTLTVSNLVYECSAVNDHTIIYTHAGAAAPMFLAQGDCAIRSAPGRVGPVYVNGGTNELKGNLLCDNYASGGSCVLKLTGTGDQTYTYSNGVLPRLEVAKASGAVLPAAGTTNLVVAGFALTQGSFTGPSGILGITANPATSYTVLSTAAGTTFNPPGTLRFRGTTTQSGAGLTFTISPAEMLTVSNLAYESGADDFQCLYSLSGAGRIVALGDLAVRSQAGRNSGAQVVLNSGTNEVRGNVLIENYAYSGTTQIKLTGGNNQTLTRTGGTPPAGTWTVDKSGGAATLATDFPLTSTGQQLVWTNGALNLSTKTLTVAGTTTIYPGATTLGVTVADATTAGRLTCSNTVSGITNVALAMAISATEGQMNGQTYAILTNTTSFGSTAFESVTWPGLWVGDVSYAASGGKVVTVSNIHQAAVGDAPTIVNLPATNVTTGGATFNGRLITNGSTSARVFVLWGETNGAVSGSWSATNSWNQGDWADNSYPSTNLTLSGSRNYYYTFGAVNLGGQTVYPDAQYLITGELTVHASDPTGRVSGADMAAFTVTRPATCTNEDLAVNYALGGTAANGTDYTIAPVSGAVVIAKGQTNGVITVTPVYKQSVEQTVTLTLVPGPYALGAPSAATCTLAMVDGPDRFWVAATPGNWNSSANWSFASGGPGGSSVPGSGNVVTFDGGGAGNCTIDATVNVVGLKLNNGYAGTVTQGSGYTVTVGATGYVQNAGTFVGGNADLTCTYFTLAGGTFTASAGTNTIAGPNIGNGTIFTYSGGTFNHNNGTLRFRGTTTSAGGGQYYTLSLANTLTVSNLVYECSAVNGHTIIYTHSGAAAPMFLVQGDCAIRSAASQTGPVYVNGGTNELKGNLLCDNYASGGSCVLKLTGTGDQTYTYSNGVLPRLEVAKASGAVLPAAGTTNLVAAGFALTQGSFTGPSGILGITANQATSYTVFSTAAGTTFNPPGTLRFRGTTTISGVGLTFTISPAEMLTVSNLAYESGTDDFQCWYSLSGAGRIVALGDLAVRSQAGRGAGAQVVLNSGANEVRGNVLIENYAYSGTTEIKLTGGNNQTLTRTGGTPPAGKWTVDKSGGTATLATDFPLTASGQQLVWTNGALNLSSNTLTVAGAVTIYSGAATLGVTVADANKAGRLTCSSAVTNIANVGLVVNVAATEAQVLGQLYTIVSNANVLAAQFESVTWQGGWKGVVAYTDNEGKNVTLSSIAKEQGSVFRFR